MISPERFKDLIKRKYYNQSDYWDSVVTPILDRLGVPKGAHIRRREFPITTHWGDRNADWLIFVENQPMLVVEAEQSEQLLQKALSDAKTFAINFKPKRKEDRDAIGTIRNVPYLFTPAGKKLVMLKLVPMEDGITLDLEPLEGLLTYEELKEIAERSVQPTKAKPLERNLLATSQFRINFEQICKLIKGRILKTEFKVSNPEDSVVFVLNELLLATFQKRDTKSIYKEYKFPKKVIQRIEEILNRYDLAQIEGPDVAYAYREFVTQNFTGKGFGWCAQEEVGRYLTPAEVISFMIKMVDIKPEDKVIDFACGSGGFLGAIASRMVNKVDINQYLKERLFACDLDPFSVSTAYTFMELLLPGKQPTVELTKESFYPKSLKPRAQISIDDVYPSLGLTGHPRLNFDRQRRKGVLNIYHHNGLFSEKKHTWEKDDLGDIIQDESFDVVISNPPGGAISGLRSKVENYLRRVLPLGDGRKLQNPVLFIQRAVQLARDNGKICLIVPDGTLANAEFKYLRDYFFERCEVKAIVSLPRGIFPNVPSKMSILYMIKKKRPQKRQRIFTAGIETDKSYNIETEFNEIYEKHKKI